MDGIDLTKKCTIVLRLVEEAEEKPNNRLEKEISQELESILGRIPWAKELEKVTVSTDRRKNRSIRADKANVQ